MEREELCERTKRFSMRIINLAVSLPCNVSGRMTAHQIIRSGSAVGANYRAACRSKSRRDFINKLKTVALLSIFVASLKTARKNEFRSHPKQIRNS